MNALFKHLPGMDLPVEKITAELSRMWSEITESEGSEFRASQLNLILHFGLQTTEEEGMERFNAAIRFAQRYPCRIIVLCPHAVEEKDGNAVQSKLFSQCYVGPTHREACCCEALILTYVPTDFGLLANQVSVWLEGDLPTYHWVHRVPAERIRSSYLSFLRLVNRVVFDSSIEVESALKVIAWPEGCRVVDLAWARILPVRQSLGQFLSAYTPDRLTRGLEKIEMTHCRAMRGEAENLLDWQRDSLVKCGLAEDSSSVAFKLIEGEDDCEATAFEIRWDYADGRFIRMHLGASDKTARLEYDMGEGTERVTLRLKLFEMEQALAEALFFSNYSGLLEGYRP